MKSEKAAAASRLPAALSKQVTAEGKGRPSQPHNRFATFFGLAALCTVLTAIDVAPERGGPGVTCDEFYHISYGKRLVASFHANGLGSFRPSCIESTFAWRKDGPPVHPPLGNWVLGWANWLFDPEPFNPLRVAITPARLGTAICFGCLALIVGLFCAAHFGTISGVIAVVSLVCMPRLFGHAHLAALDLITATMCTATIVAVTWAEQHKRWYSLIVAGVIWGLALLTRFHGLLCLPPVVCYLCYRYRWRAMPLAMLWLISGLITFFLGWPWLWLDPLGHIQQYLISSTQRIHIHTFYLGRVWNDTVVPWHYPWVMFLVTLPPGLLFLGLAGIISPFLRARSISETQQKVSTTEPAGIWLVFGTICFFLLVFSLPGVPVYDGVRLFLPVYPLWAILVGQGTLVASTYLKCTMQRHHTLRAILVCAFFASQAVGTVWFRPVWLSYYNCLVGGLAGAEKLGFEVNYWGDALTEEILCRAAEQIRPGESLSFAPSLAPYQAAGILVASPCLMKQEILLKAWSQETDDESTISRWLLIYHRRSDLPESLVRLIDERPAVAEVTRQGVWLAKLIALGGADVTRPAVNGSDPTASSESP
ncbi:MAG TPA: glycosyltransferase family 39 protein [Thermogutta sp.]|nr:glycosyltransferase family 39 protein [Thermogutta sp.]